MAEHEFSALAAISAFSDPANEIIVWTPLTDIAEYRGTRAALEAEGVIPARIAWPDGFAEIEWSDGRFSYRLRRRRPDGVKGPRKQLLDVDWWAFRCDPLHRDPLARRAEIKAKELAAIRHLQTAEGMAEHSEKFRRYFRALEDEKYQAFKAMLPGIDRPKRGRKPKSNPQPQNHPDA